MAIHSLRSGAFAAAGVATRQHRRRAEQLQADGAGELQLHLLHVELERVDEPPHALHLRRRSRPRSWVALSRRRRVVL